MTITATAEQEPEPEQEAVFGWSRGGGHISPAAAAYVVQELYVTTGVVTPQAIVEASRPVEATLHSAFTWDDAVAAESFRTEQARSILRRLTVSYRKPDGTTTEPTRYFVKLIAAADDEPDADLVEATESMVYIPISRVMSEQVLRRKYVRDAYRAAQAWSRRYRDILELSAIHEAIDGIPPDFLEE